MRCVGSITLASSRARGQGVLNKLHPSLAARRFTALALIVSLGLHTIAYADEAGTPRKVRRREPSSHLPSLRSLIASIPSRLLQDCSCCMAATATTDKAPRPPPAAPPQLLAAVRPCLRGRREIDPYCPCRHAGVTGTIGGGANSNTVGAGSQNAYNSYNKLNSENAYNVRSTIEL